MKPQIDPKNKLPVSFPDGSPWPHTIFLKSYIDHPNIQIGDYTYFNDFRLPVADVRQLLVPYYQAKWPNKGDTIVGNDIWIGHEALIMPAVSIGDGAIVASRSVVTCEEKII